MVKISKKLLMTSLVSASVLSGISINNAQAAKKENKPLLETKDAINSKESIINNLISSNMVFRSADFNPDDQTFTSPRGDIYFKEMKLHYVDSNFNEIADPVIITNADQVHQTRDDEHTGEHYFNIKAGDPSNLVPMYWGPLNVWKMSDDGNQVRAIFNGDGNILYSFKGIGKKEGTASNPDEVGWHYPKDGAPYYLSPTFPVVDPTPETYDFYNVIYGDNYIYSGGFSGPEKNNLGILQGDDIHDTSSLTSYMKYGGEWLGPGYHIKEGYKLYAMGHRNMDGGSSDNMWSTKDFWANNRRNNDVYVMYDTSAWVEEPVVAINFVDQYGNKVKDTELYKVDGGAEFVYDDVPSIEGYEIDKETNKLMNKPADGGVKGLEFEDDYSTFNAYVKKDWLNGTISKQNMQYTIYYKRPDEDKIQKGRTTIQFVDEQGNLLQERVNSKDVDGEIGSKTYFELEAPYGYEYVTADSSGISGMSYKKGLYTGYAQINEQPTTYKMTFRLKKSPGITVNYVDEQGKPLLDVKSKTFGKGAKYGTKFDISKDVALTGDIAKKYQFVKIGKGSTSGVYDGNRQELTLVYHKIAERSGGVKIHYEDINGKEINHVTDEEMYGNGYVGDDFDITSKQNVVDILNPDYKFDHVKDNKQLKGKLTKEQQEITLVFKEKLSPGVKIHFEDRNQNPIKGVDDILLGKDSKLHSKFDFTKLSDISKVNKDFEFDYIKYGEDLKGEYLRNLQTITLVYKVASPEMQSAGFKIHYQDTKGKDIKGVKDKTYGKGSLIGSKYDLTDFTNISHVTTDYHYKMAEPSIGLTGAFEKELQTVNLIFEKNSTSNSGNENKPGVNGGNNNSENNKPNNGGNNNSENNHNGNNSGNNNSGNNNSGDNNHNGNNNSGNNGNSENNKPNNGGNNNSENNHNNGGNNNSENNHNGNNSGNNNSGDNNHNGNNNNSENNKPNGNDNKPGTDGGKDDTKPNNGNNNSSNNNTDGDKNDNHEVLPPIVNPLDPTNPDNSLDPNNPGSDQVIVPENNTDSNHTTDNGLSIDKDGNIVDENGQIIIDHNGNHLDKDGNVVINPDGEHVDKDGNVIKDDDLTTDENNNKVDHNNQVIVDEDGNHVDKDGNIVLDNQGNHLDTHGNIITEDLLHHDVGNDNLNKDDILRFESLPNFRFGRHKITSNDTKTFHALSQDNAKSSRGDSVAVPHYVQVTQGEKTNHAFKVMISNSAFMTTTGENVLGLTLNFNNILGNDGKGFDVSLNGDNQAQTLFEANGTSKTSSILFGGVDKQDRGTEKQFDENVDKTKDSVEKTVDQAVGLQFTPGAQKINDNVSSTLTWTLMSAD